MIETLVSVPVEGQRVVGTLCLPKGGPAPVVLIFHGFTGSRDAWMVAGTGEAVLARVARRLAQQGMSSLRIDFRGSGDSEGDLSDMTYERQIADGLAALSVLKQEPRVLGDRTCLLGWSQGGLVASAVAGRSNRPAATALWAALADPVGTISGLLGADVVAAGLKTGSTPLPITMIWKDFALKQGYFDGLMAMDPPAEIAAYRGPLFVAHGWQDEAVAPDAAQKFLSAHKGAQESWLKDMDHSFNADSGPGTLDRLTDATADFFRRHVRV